MTFKDAANFVMPFGKYKGKTLDAIATDDEGLRYLDWLRGAREEDREPHTAIDYALDAYLSDPSICRELEDGR